MPPRGGRYGPAALTLAALLICGAAALVRSSFVDSVAEIRLLQGTGPLLHTSRHLLLAVWDLGARALAAGSGAHAAVGLGTAPWWVVAAEAVVGCALVVKGYLMLVTPMNRVRTLEQVGYVPEGGATLSESVRRVQRRRAVGQVPPVYPNGWFSVLESRDLKPGEVKNVGCLGKNLAVFRGEDGRAQVLDAYCPHMGANLGVGGLVKGNCLECPFHGWKFRGDDGKCVHIPYCEDSKHIPDSARVQSYLVLERNGFIYIWHHAEGAEPDWQPPEIPEIASGQWRYGGRTEHAVSAHIEEIPENGADVAHLPQVHTPFMASGVDLRYTRATRLWQFARHDWVGDWASDPEERHVGVLTLRHGISLFGCSLKLINMDVEARQIGPGIVYLTFDSPFGRGAYLQSLTPTEPLLQRMIHHVYFPRAVPYVVSKFFLLGEALQIERDMMIWNNKTFLSRPVFIKSREDSLLAKHRRWYSQFYSEHSPRLQTKNPLDW